MVKRVVHDCRARAKALAQFIIERADCHRTSFELSDVKGDGTVFVRFRSSTQAPAIVHAESFRDALNAGGILFDQTEDTKFRLALDQFASGSV